MDLQERMNQALSERLPYGSTPYSMTSNLWVTPARRQFFRLAASALRTSGNGSTGEPSGWPTPMAGSPATETYNEAGNTDSSRRTVALVSAGRGTPTAQDARHATLSPAQQGRDPNVLHNQAHATGWPTPCTPSGGRTLSIDKMDATGRTTDGRKHTASLEHAVKFIPGPTPNGSPASTEKPGQLAPDFTRWLMGYPPEHLSCAPMGTPSSRK